MKRLNALLLTALLIISFLILGAPLPKVSAVSNDRIVYMSDGPTDIISVKTDGSDRRDLGSGIRPAVSPDGSKVAFIRYVPETRLTNVYVINMDGTNLTLVGSNINPNNGDAPIDTPSWSPDGSRIAFMRLFSRFPFSAHIYTVNPDGTNEVDLTPNITYADFRPVWSPVGNKILFTQNQNNSVGLFTMNPDGTNIQQVVLGVGEGAWSPDGTKISYSSTSSASSGLHVVNSDGTNDVTVSGPPTVYSYKSAWSPDSTYIAFESSCNCSQPSTLEVVHPDGTGQRTLITGANTDDTPGWSPDSSLVLSLSPTVSHSLAVTPVGGGPTQTLFTDPNGILMQQWVKGPKIVLPMPTNLHAVTPTQTPILGWDAVTGANAYKIYRNGSLLASSTSPSYTDTTAGEGNQTYYVVASDTTGAQEDSPPSATIAVLVDKTGPLVTATTTPAPNSAGWNNSNVTVSFTCSDALSGVQTCPAPVTVSTEGANQQITRSATDNAGNTSSTTVTMNLDKTAPTTTNATTSSFIVFPGSTVTFSASASDTLSGVTKGEYYLDTDPGAGNGAAMSYVNGKITVSTTLNTTFGWHRVYMRSQDKAGNWSTVASVMVFYL